MCLPDEAEYWWDIKAASQRHRNKHVFTHKKGLECGHHHIYETKKIKHVDCNACIKILKNTIHDYDKIMIAKSEPMGDVCICGAVRVKRVNRTTKEEFLGCTRWPKCKLTSKYVKK